jgi:formyl-CoA transferase
MKKAALDGIRVLEMGQLIAGPFATKLLGEFGADVIKIEPRDGGDPLRVWRRLHRGTSLWWAVQSRNKRSIALDLQQEAGREIVRRLVKETDILVENFRPGVMAKWGLGWEELSAINPGLVMVRVSGYGQTGPYKNRPGFGLIGEAMGGLRFVTGEPGRPPVRAGISIGDTLTALHAMIGAMVALRHREVNGGKGQVVDVALYESVFSVMESLVAEYDYDGFIRKPGGPRLPGIAPSSAYPTGDGKYALIGGNGDKIFKRLMKAIGRDDLGDDPVLAHNDGRVREVDKLDAAITEWTMKHTLEEVLQEMDKAEVPAGRVYTAADIANDPQYQAREMIKKARLPGGMEVKVPGIVPKLTETPGEIRSDAPELGADTDRVLEALGYDEATRAKLREAKVI